jgi:hypothetical protein
MAAAAFCFDRGANQNDNKSVIGVKPGINW